MGAGNGRSGRHERINTFLACGALLVAGVNSCFDVRRGIADDADRAIELLNEAWLEAKSGRLDLALYKIVEAEHRVDGRTPRSLALRGYLETKREAVALAIPFYEDALELKEDDVFALSLLGDALFKIGKVEPAESRLVAALRLAKSQRADGDTLSSVLVSLGNVRRRQGRKEEALDCYEQAKAANPSNSKARVALANTYFSLGRFEEALAEYDFVLVGEPENAGYLSSVARLLYLLGDPELAEEALRRSLAIQGDGPNYELLALIVREQGDEVEADRYLRLSERSRSLKHLGRLREPGAIFEATP